VNTLAFRRALLGVSSASPAQANLLFNPRAATFFTLSRQASSQQSTSGNQPLNLTAKRFFSQASQEDGSDNEEVEDQALTSSDESDAESNNARTERAPRQDFRNMGRGGLRGAQEAIDIPNLPKMIENGDLDQMDEF
jgi:cytoskeletal protein RodZ